MIWNTVQPVQWCSGTCFFGCASSANFSQLLTFQLSLGRLVRHILVLAVLASSSKPSWSVLRSIWSWMFDINWQTNTRIIRYHLDIIYISLYRTFNLSHKIIWQDFLWISGSMSLPTPCAWVMWATMPNSPQWAWATWCSAMVDCGRTDFRSVWIGLQPAHRGNPVKSCE